MGRTLSILNSYLPTYFSTQEKERKREHMVLMKQFENRKKNDDRKKKIEEFKVSYGYDILQCEFEQFQF